MKILIAGDLVPTQANLEFFQKGEIEKILDNQLLKMWNEADVRIFNLECPLTESNNKILKAGPHLKAPLNTINGIIKLNPAVISIANNHIMDFGVEGLKDTINVLNENRIPFLGAGLSLEEARKPYIIEKNGLKIGVYSSAENEFASAGIDYPGANGYDPLEIFDDIKSLKSQCDYLIVLFHGGKEHYRYPSPVLQRISLKMVESGANLVICQHSHAVGCKEEYLGSKIVYGQGNFIFNLEDHDNNEFWNNGLLIDVKLREKSEIKYIPFITNIIGIEKPKEDKEKEILENFLQRSAQILEEKFILENYSDFGINHIYRYLNIANGTNHIIGGIDRRFLKSILKKCRYSKKKILSLINIIECEAHRELFLQGLKDKLK